MDIVEVTGVVAHPPDSEDGVRYESVHDRALEWGLPVIRGRAKTPEVTEFVRAAAPDLLWVTDYRYLLPEELTALAPRGAVNLHPSLLPRYRGRASINWAILYGESEIGLTAHFIAEGADTGDIIEQRAVSLFEEEDIGDALNRLMPLYDSLTREVAVRFLKAPVYGTPQDHARATEFPARKPKDGRIDWNRPAYEIRDLIRAVAAPYPGAFTDLSGARMYFWKARLGENSGSSLPASPGTVTAITEEGGFWVCCGDGPLYIKDWSTDPEGAVVPFPGLSLMVPEETG
ncbi:methionyl-tRNA formyltransferase [Thiohalorhabdus sp. Cl-TMA]|uniref:Methionyl-tRNA formyltransferase n=1 Tax=Thiohalorhabdus methylotrophus TaxID=3242694 RepID=A0ABV4TZ17_9GAMM